MSFCGGATSSSRWSVLVAFLEGGLIDSDVGAQLRLVALQPALHRAQHDPAAFQDSPSSRATAAVAGLLEPIDDQSLEEW